MATPTSGSRGTTLPDSLSTPGSISQEARRKAEERTKRRAKELASKLRTSLKEEEEEDPITLSSNDEEYIRSETPSQSDLVDKSKTLPFKMNWPTIRSTPGKPTTRPKRKATRNQSAGSSSNIRKKCRG